MTLHPCLGRPISFIKLHKSCFKGGLSTGGRNEAWASHATQIHTSNFATIEPWLRIRAGVSDRYRCTRT
jgi:hypothetical protein